MNGHSSHSVVIKKIHNIILSWIPTLINLIICYKSFLDKNISNLLSVSVLKSLSTLQSMCDIR